MDILQTFRRGGATCAVTAMAVAVAAALTFTTTAHAAMFVEMSFERIGDGNGSADAADNFLLTISEADDRIRFRFDNFGNTADVDSAVIERVFFQDSMGLFLEDGELIDFDPALHIDASAGVNYGMSGYGSKAGGNLPGGKSVGFDTTFWLGADSPRPHNGVGIGEFVHFDLAMADGYTFGDVSSHLLNDLMAGLHVQNISVADAGGDWSDAFVTTTAVLIPTPGTATVGLALMGMLCAGRTLRPRRVAMAFD